MNPSLGHPVAAHDQRRPGNPAEPRSTTHSRAGRWSALLALGALLLGAWTPAGAEIQFDVFVGFDDRVREGHWFPVAFELQNDGPTLTGTVVFGPEAGFDAQQRQFTIELPTGTRKRTVIPAFSTAGRYARWDARLLDGEGKVLAERSGIQPRDLSPHVPLLGALPRSFGGLPTLPEIKDRPPELLPTVARLQSELIPANPIALEGLSALYLNSSKAGDLKVDQVDALLTWVHGGGHLIVAIEQPNEVNAVPWLQLLLPFAPDAVVNRVVEGAFEQWLVAGRPPVGAPAPPQRPPRSRSQRPPRPSAAVPIEMNPADPFAEIQPDPGFAGAEMPLVTGRVSDGEILVVAGDMPLIVSAARGRGRVTVLTFSPEREPFRIWKDRPWFWAKLIAVPTELLIPGDVVRWGGTSIDAVFGAMLDSRQVRKLPVAALLLLLVVYLGVIGPFDQWFLKRIGKQMWTWLTFPLYVILFSGLIYFIGYRLRAGDLEWNEIQVVDQLPRQDDAILRGRTWLSLYSPVNARYRIASDQSFAALRSEFQAVGTGRSEAGRMQVRYPAKGFESEVFVPVWVSQLYASDWIDAGPRYLEGRIETREGAPFLVVENRSEMRFSELRLAYGGQLFNLGELGPRQRLDRRLSPDSGSPLVDALTSHAHEALRRAQERRFAFGQEGSGQLSRDLDGVVLASFAEKFAHAGYDQGQSLTAPGGFDLSPLFDRGDAILFGWAPEQSVAQPIHRFSPRRLKRDSVLRVALPISP